MEKMNSGSERDPVFEGLMGQLRNLTQAYADAEKNETLRGSNPNGSSKDIEGRIKTLIADNPKYAEKLDEEWVRLEERLADRDQRTYGRRAA